MSEALGTGLARAVAPGCKAGRAARLGGTAAALLAAAACSDSKVTGVPMAVPGPTRLSAAVTGAAAAAVDAEGRLVLPSPARGSQYPELDQAGATSLARAWVRDYAGGHTTFLSETRGAPVKARELAPCGRPLYARSALTAPPATVAPPFRRRFGSWWLVTLCGAGGEPQVSLAVSAWATEVSVEGGHVRFPFVAGSEFFAIGIPRGHVGEFPAAPEVAVTLASEQSGGKVTAVPELVAPAPDDGPPQRARWMVQLDRQARWRGANGVSVASERVGIARAGLRGPAAAVVLVPAASQPDDVLMAWAEVPTPGETGRGFDARARHYTGRLARRTDTPITFERVDAPEGR